MLVHLKIKLANMVTLKFPVYVNTMCRASEVSIYNNWPKSVILVCILFGITRLSYHSIRSDSLKSFKYLKYN